MKNSELRGYAAPPKRETSLVGLLIQGLIASAVTGAALFVFFRPDAVSGAWAAITRGSGSAQVTTAAPPPMVKAQAAPSMPSINLDLKQVSGTLSMLGNVNQAGMSALGMQDVMMGNVKDPAKAAAIMEQHSKNLRAMQKDASKVLGVPDLDSLELAEDTPVGADMLEACRKQAADNTAGSMFKKPAAVARFTHCYMTTKLARLCDPVQKKALIEVLAWHGAAQKFWKLHDEKKTQVTYSEPPKPGDWDNPASRALPAGIAKLGAQGYISVSDFGWFPPPEIKAALDGVKAERNPCATAQN